MTTSAIQTNIIYGLGEGQLVSDASMLAYALRYANAAYREIFSRYRFKSLHTRSVFRTADGQQTYQAPDDFLGFLVLRDESSGNILDQITPQEFARTVSTSEVTDESFTSSHEVAVSLDNRGILQYSETVTTTDGATTYIRDTDYTMGYAAGTITTLSTGAMSDDTEYYIDYLHYTKGDPSRFCLEYDATNKKFVFRLDPTPDDTHIGSMLYPAVPADLATGTNPIWGQLEFALERGGIYFGSLELIDDAQKRAEFKQMYEVSMQALIQVDQEMVPKQDRIKVVMKKSDYT